MVNGGITDSDKSYLERVVFNTVRYFDIFEMPVTAVQIWRVLIVSGGGSGVRWRGSHIFSLREIREVLENSNWLRERLSYQWGYWGMKNSMGTKESDKKKWVSNRLRRHAIAQQKWKIVRRAVWWMGWAPFVKMIGVTGSLSLDNTRPESDLDLLVIVKSGRIWTARILLLMTVQLLGCRRKYWDQEAPDKICLNHFITDDNLVMAKEIRTLYTAVLYTRLRPVVGLDVYQDWWEENGYWIRRFLMMPSGQNIESRWLVRTPTVFKWIKKVLEGVFSEPVGEVMERGARSWQEKMIERHSRGGRPGQPGRIFVSDTELAFHPDSKERLVLTAFAQEPGQERLL